MTYYMLPKNKGYLNISPSFKQNNAPYVPCISHSVQYYNDIVNKQIVKLQRQHCNSLDSSFDSNFNNFKINQAFSIVNPYQYLFSKIPMYQTSVSKFTDSSHILYELIETSVSCNIFDYFKFIPKINVCHISGHDGANRSSVELLRIMREFKKSDFNFCEQNIDIVVSKLLSQGGDNCNDNANDNANNANDDFCVKKYDIMFFNFDDVSSNLSTFFRKLLLCLYAILKLQNVNGTSIIKLDNLQYSFTIDVLYVLNTIFDKVCIIKPLASSMIESSKYVVCKNMTISSSFAAKQLINSLETLLASADTCANQMCNMVSLIQTKTPQHFLNKIEEINIIVGQQQLDGFCQIINLLNNKNKEDKIELFKRNNINKCIQWCEKHQIPYNKFIEKHNAFTLNAVCSKNIFNGKHLDEANNLNLNNFATKQRSSNDDESMFDNNNNNDNDNDNDADVDDADVDDADAYCCFDAATTA